MRIEDLPPIRDIIRKFDLGARKSLGQNFILDLNVTRKIAQAAGDLTSFTIIEVGPGPGALTRSLLLEGAKTVIAIEKDRRCIAALKSLEEASNDRLKLIEADAMEIDLQQIVRGPYKIVSNLPYNLSTQLLMHWLDNRHNIVSLTLMFQKEVAERLVAQPGTKDYGRLSILTQLCGDVRIKLVLSPQVFIPAPSVYSALIHLDMFSLPRHNCDWNALKEITRYAFAQRRKMLRSTLSPAFQQADKVLENIGINPTLRAENLTIDQFCLLARTYTDLRNK